MAVNVLFSWGPNISIGVDKTSNIVLSLCVCLGYINSTDEKSVFLDRNKKAVHSHFLKS